MPSVPGTELRRMLDLAVAALHEPRPEELLPMLCAELLCGCDADLLIHKGEAWTEEAGAIRLWSHDGAVTVPETPAGPATAPAGPPTSSTGPAAARTTVGDRADGTALAARADLAGRGGRLIRRGYPFAGHYGASPERQPLTARQAVGEAAWRRSATAEYTREALGADHVLAIPLPRGGEIVSGFLAYRRRSDFPRDRIEYARHIQPLLDGVERQSRLLRAWRGATAAQRRSSAEAEERARALKLTPREITVLSLLAEALTAEAIGRRLGISVRTVHKHVENLYRKLGTRDRLATVLRAQQAGLLPEAVTGGDGAPRRTATARPGQAV